MKAILCRQYGLPEALQFEDIARPTPGADEILVRVHAATVNRTDCGILQARPFIIRFFTGLTKPKRSITGTDFAGEVEAVGSAVKHFKAGDLVFGFDDMGLSTHAQFMTITEKKAIARMPDHLTFEAAAASLEGAHYAHNFINKVKLTADSKVMINGATGAIGSAALQMTKATGAYVTAVGNTKNLELLRSLGADRVINYENEDFTQDQERYHFVFDAVGKSTFGRCKSLLLPGGAYISSELGPRSQNIFYALATPLLGGKKVIFPFPSDIKKSIEVVIDLIEKGKFKPVIDRKYPLRETAEAFRYVLTGQKTGNVVIEV